MWRTRPGVRPTPGNSGDDEGIRPSPRTVVLAVYAATGSRKTAVRRGRSIVPPAHRSAALCSLKHHLENGHGPTHFVPARDEQPCTAAEELDRFRSDAAL